MSHSACVISLRRLLIFYRRSQQILRFTLSIIVHNTKAFATLVSPIIRDRMMIYSLYSFQEYFDTVAALRMRITKALVSLKNLVHRYHDNPAVPPYDAALSTRPQSFDIHFITDMLC